MRRGRPRPARAWCWRCPPDVVSALASPSSAQGFAPAVVLTSSSGIFDPGGLLTPAQLFLAVTDPQARIVKGYPPVMPAQALSESELAAVVEYIKTLQGGEVH